MSFLRTLPPLFAALALPLLGAPHARTKPPDRRELARQARDAYARGDFSAFSGFTERLLRLNPENAEARYNLACGDALSGRPDAALRELGELDRAGLKFDPARDDDLQTLRDRPEFPPLAARLARNGEPRGAAETAFTLPAEPLLSEGLAYDPVEKNFYVGSVHRRQIFRVGPDGRAEPFTAPGQDGLWGVFALKVDPARRLLWATSNALAQMEGYTAADAGGAGLFKYDLTRGKLLQRYLLPAGGTERHNLNDLTLDESGDVWLTDSLTPALYRLDPDRGELVLMARHPAWISLQGLAFAPGGKRLFIADHAGGIYRYDVRKRRAERLAHPAGMNLAGIDGLVFHDGRLLAVQNRYAPHRVVRLSLDPAGRRVVALEVLAAALPEFDEPTLGVVAEGAFHFVANSQWGKYRDDGTIAKPPDAVRVMKIKLQPADSDIPGLLSR
jgi:sugar lactone lactonase YvrE